jgi:hypothetical protein
MDGRGLCDLLLYSTQETGSFGCIRAWLKRSCAPADMLPHCALHCCLVADIGCHHQDIHPGCLLLQLLTLHDTAQRNSSRCMHHNETQGWVANLR